MKINFIKCYTVLMFLFLFFASPVFAEKVDGFDDLLAKLPRGAASKEDNISVIKHGQAFVTSRQARKKRKLIYNRPIDAVRLNKKYTSITFDTTIITKKKDGKSIKTPAFFSLLFVNGKKGTFDFSNGKYIGWIGEKDISEYRKLSPKKLSRYYKNAGVRDCTYRNVSLAVVYGKKKGEPELEKVPEREAVYRDEFEIRLKEKANVVHSHDGADIVSGSVALRHIEAGYVKKSELGMIVPQIMLGTAIAAKSTMVSRIDYDRLANRFANLEKKVKHLSDLLAGVSRKGSEIVFSNVNLHLVNGTGTTDGKINGLGNFIIGYNNKLAKKTGQGSHNLCIGKGNKFLSYGGLVAGEGNVISGKYAIAVGGSSNTAKGAFSSVTGGTKNSATGKFSNISGGTKRSVSGKNPHFIKK